MPSTEPDKAAADDYLVARLQDAWARDPRLNELDVAVTIAGSGAFLDGIVTTEERRDAVGEVAGKLLGPEGYEVHNGVSVAPLTEPSPSEVEELS